MKLKTKILILLLLWVQVAKANMSSPIREGTLISSAISSKNIDILSERIYVTIDPRFETAKFTVEYTIRNTLSGRQIPLLFYAKDFKADFFVWLDNKEIGLQDVPTEYYKDTVFTNFLTSSNIVEKSNEVVIHWQKNESYTYKLNDLKYFETDIKKVFIQ